MNKARVIGTIVGGLVSFGVCQYLRMKQEEKQLKEIHDIINRSTKDLMEQVNRDMASFSMFSNYADERIEETKRDSDEELGL